ncbi:hypothetical protein JCM31598_04620 [Desulfonatronum parangueonense]
MKYSNGWFLQIATNLLLDLLLTQTGHENQGVVAALECRNKIGSKINPLKNYQLFWELP